MSQLLDDLREKLGGGDLQKSLQLLIDGAVCAAGNGRVPVDLSLLAQRFGIVEIEHGKSLADGRLVPLSGGKFRAEIGVFQSTARARFSLAHEIAHAVIFSVLPQYRQLSHRGLFAQPGAMAEERLCDWMAGHILMPDFAVNSVASESSLFTRIESLSRLCNTSISASSRRLQEHESRHWALLSICMNRAQEVCLLSNFANNPLRRIGPLRFSKTGDVLRLTKNRTSGEGFDWLRCGTVSVRCAVEVRSRSSGTSALVLARKCIGTSSDASAVHANPDYSRFGRCNGSNSNSPVNAKQDPRIALHETSVDPCCISNSR